MSLSKEELNKLWESAFSLRSGLDAADYKHIVLGLVFLKYISDAFEERREELKGDFEDPKSESYKKSEKLRADALEERDYYSAANVFWVPEKSRWLIVQQNSKRPDIANIVDDALFEIEKSNPKLEGIVQRSYASSKLPPVKLGEVVDLVGSINFNR